MANSPASRSSWHARFRACALSASTARRMPSQSRRRSKPVSDVTAPRRLEAFLEMLAAERGAARLTLEAYRNDLAQAAAFLKRRGVALADASDDDLRKYMAGMAEAQLAAMYLRRSSSDASASATPRRFR